MSGAPSLTPGRMTVSQIETVLGKALKDPDFAKQLQADPEAALQAMGYTPHDEEIAFFTALGKGGFGAAATTLHGTDPGHYMSEA